MSDEGGTAAHIACEVGNIALLELLLTRDRDALTRRNAESGASLLHYAALSDRPECVHWLVSQRSVDVNAVTLENETAGFAAVGKIKSERATDS